MPVDRVTELIQEGLRRKLSGDPAGAAQAWQEALGLDPENKRARTYLDNLLVSGALDQAVAGKKKNPFVRPEGKESEAVVFTPSPFAGEDSSGPALTPLSMISAVGSAPAKAEEPASPAPSVGPAGEGAPAPTSTLLFGDMPTAVKAPKPKRSPGVRHDPPARGKRQPDGDSPAGKRQHAARSAFETFTFGSPAPHPVAVAKAAEPPERPRASDVPGAEIPGWGMPGLDSEPPAEPAGDAVAPTSPAAPAAGTLETWSLPSPNEPPEPQEESPEDAASLLRRAADLLDLDDHSGALEAAEKALALDPSNLTARDLVSRCENTLLAMYESKIGDLKVKPRVRMPPDEIVWLNLDHRAGYVLSLVDGEVEFDDLFALSCMSRLETARILARLLQERVIG
ncbi:MAG: hypothetical protein ACOX6T_20820 [Myxococcales bacterium]|jgi:tetratricopeptide (TPR) repeat protein